MSTIERFTQISVERLARDLLNRAVTIELLLIDNSMEQLSSNQELYLERHAAHEPEPNVIRDFVAIHYTPLLRVWNRGVSGIVDRPEVGPEDILIPAVRILALTTTITGFSQTRVPRLHDAAPLELLCIENSAGILLEIPLHPLPHTAEGAPLAMTILTNPQTLRREYTLRLYNLAVVITLQD